MKAEQRPSRQRGSGGSSGNSNAYTSGAPARSGKGYLFSGLLFVLLSGVAGAGYWQASELHKTLADTRQALEQTREQLGQVTGQVSQAGATITQSDSTFRGELKVVNSEIRKLWDVSNKRNRQWITQNQERIEQLNRRVDEVAKQADAGNTSARRATAKLSEIDQVVKALANEQLAANSTMTAKVDALTAEIASLQKLLGAQKSWEEQLKASSETQAELSKKLSAFQSQISLRLQQMENSVRELHQPKESAELIMQ